MKKILIAVAVLIAVVAGGLVYLGSNIDGIVRDGVERYGPRFTGTDVRLGAVKSSLFGGEVTLDQVFLGNPKGFQTPHAVKVDRVRMVVDPKSVLSDVVLVKELVIEAPDIIYEMGQGSSNLQTIQKNLTQAAGSGQPTAPDRKAPEAEGGKKVVIENLYIRRANAAVSGSVLGSRVVAVPLPDLHLTDIGKKSNGATMAEASKQVMDAVTASVTSAVGKIDLKGLSQDAEKLLGGAGKEAGEQLKGIEDKLKGLFGK